MKPLPFDDRPTAERKAARGECDGGCAAREDGECKGQTRAVHVISPRGHDWGWFSYCDTAREEDTKRGFTVIEA